MQEDEVVENDIKKIKSREWEKDKSDSKDEQVKPESKDGTVFESRVYREQRKIGVTTIIEKKKRLDNDKKDEELPEDMTFRKDKKDKFKESPREQKSKKYSDTRKERINKTEYVKTEKQSVISKMISSENKSKSHNYDDIKPFTQLPQVKTDDLTVIMEGLDKKMKLENAQVEIKSESNDGMHDKENATTKMRRNSLESSDINVKDELKRQKSLDDRGKSTDREESEEVDKSEGTDRRTERRIRNKVSKSIVVSNTLFLIVCIF